MNKENCTKGPVTVQPLQADEGQSIAIVSAKAGVLATIPPLPEGEKGPEPKEDHANAEELVKRWNAYPELLAALEALELRCAQARIASSIGKPRLKDADFLRHECERMAKDARAAITKATGETL